MKKGLTSEKYLHGKGIISVLYAFHVLNPAVWGMGQHVFHLKKKILRKEASCRFQKTYVSLLDFPSVPSGLACSPSEKCYTREVIVRSLCRLRGETCCKAETKAVREKLRRERFNEKILELSSLIDPTRPVRSDKLAILGDTIQILKQLKTEAHELEEARKKLNEEIKNLKAEKNELCQENIALKADKERIEQQLKMVSSTSFTPSHPAAYHPMANPTPLFPGYSMVPMWQCLPQTALQRYKDPDPRPAA
ncbi:unnamed protein product [Rhodiola kirilowii]